MSRFFVEGKDITASEIVINNSEDIHHITNVLRLKAGMEIEISDSKEWEYIAALTSVSQDGVHAKILDKSRFSREPAIKITLFQCIPKQGKIESIIQKSVELGVCAIIPVISARTIIAEGGNIKNKTVRWRKIAGEAAKQCRRGAVPEVAEVTLFSGLIDEFNREKYEMMIFPNENEKEYSIKDALKSLIKPPRTLSVVIGPEGGYSEEEVEALKATGAKSVSLGKTILRTETAGPAAIAMIMYELEL